MKDQIFVDFILYDDFWVGDKTNIEGFREE